MKSLKCMAEHRAQLHSVLNYALDQGKWLTSCPGHFTLRKYPQCPLNRRLGAAQSWSRHFGEHKNLLPLPGFKSHSKLFNISPIFVNEL